MRTFGRLVGMAVAAAVALPIIALFAAMDQMFYGGFDEEEPPDLSRFED